MDKILERIMRETGRRPVECQCAECKSRCKKVPCLGTPQDILRLIEAGYGRKLVPVLWMAGIASGAIRFPVPMVQPRRTPSGCVFFEDGLCVLHGLGLKPTEGRLSYHTLIIEDFFFTKSLTWNVAKEWMNPENIDVLVRVFENFGLRG